MKSLTNLILIIVVLLFSCKTEDPKIVEARQLIQQLKDKSESVGWSVTISKDNQIILSEGFGFGNYEQQIPVYPDKTKFRIGSISKALTAAGLGILMEQEKIDIDAPVQNYATYFPEKEYTITTRQVAGHLAGIRHYNGEEFMSSKHYETVNEGLEIFMNDSLLFEPGTNYSYSSYGFNLVSAAMEGASGEEFLAFMKTHVFVPLGMSQTIPEFNDSIIAFRSGFYTTLDNGKNINAPYVDNSYKWAGGGFLSTSEDLVKFGNAMLNNVLFPKEITDELTTTQITLDGAETGYGIGFSTETNEFGRKFYGHGGGSVGGTSCLLIFPEYKLVVAAVTNDTNSTVGGDMHQVAEIFLKD